PALETTLEPAAASRDDQKTDADPAPGSADRTHRSQSLPQCATWKHRPTCIGNRSLALQTPPYLPLSNSSSPDTQRWPTARRPCLSSPPTAARSPPSTRPTR